MFLSLKNIVLKLTLLGALLILLGFVGFRVFSINLSPYLITISVLIILAEFHSALLFFTMIYSLWPRKYPVYEKINNNRDAQINMFICVCGEPPELVRNTILAAQKARDLYMQKVQPKVAPNVVVLNDGLAAGKDNWQDIESLANELHVSHVVRSESTGFKAGNLNNGFKMFPTNDAHNTYDVVLDADFVVIPEFLLEITKPLIHDDIDFVQTPQRYSNETTWVAQAAAAHQILFFEHICSAKAYVNALFLCGTNFVIRRSALDSVNGMDERFITEDFATSLNLHLNGKKGTFIKKPLAYGIAPSTLKAYFGQQRRWSQGTFDTTLVFARQILFGPLTFQQKIAYFVSGIYYLQGLRNLFLMLSSLPFLLFGTQIMRSNTGQLFTFVYAAFFIINFAFYFALFRHPLKSWVLDTISFPIFIAALFSSLFKKKLGFIVTIKRYQKENIFNVYKVQLIVAILLASSLGFALLNHRIAYSWGQFINYFWVVFNTCVLALGFYLYFKDNFITGFDGVEVINRKRAQLVRALEIGVFGPVFIGLLGMVILQNPALVRTIQTGFQTVQASTHHFVSSKLSVPESGVYYGYYLPGLNAHPQNPEIGLTSSEKPSLSMYYQDWGSKTGFDISFMNELSSKNVVPIVTWEPWSAQKASEKDLTQSNYAPKVIASGKYDTYIRDFARGAATYNKPYFLRFAHEMNGNWYSWGAIDGNTPEDYKKMWIHVHDIFVEEGATNTIWVWTPNNEDNYGKADTIVNYYPGDEYVDWVGYSGFNWGNTGAVDLDRTFEELTLGIYPVLSSLNKPIMVAETSTVGTDAQKAKWLEKMAEQITYFGKIKAVVFYNDKFKYSDFKLSSVTNIGEIVNTIISENDYFLKYPLIEISSSK